MIFLLSFLLSVFHVQAQSVNIKACEADVQKFCSEDPSLACLLKNESSVAVDCKRELQLASQAAKAIGVRGGSGLSSFGGVIGNFGLIQPNKRVISINGLIAPESSDFQQYKVNYSSPVWMKGKESLSMSLGAGGVHFEEDLTLPDVQIKVPRTLRRVELGANYTKTLNDQKVLGVRGSVGSAGDELFYGSRDLIFSVNAFYGYPSTKENRYWLLTVFASNNNPLINYVPIPGFVYFYKEGRFTGMFGLPFASIQWSPVDPISLSMSFFVTNFNLEVTYGHRDQLQYFTGFSFGQQTFLRHDRKEIDDRFFMEEKKLFIGARTSLTETISGDVQVGQSFDRRFFEGKRFSDKDSGVASLEASWYLGTNLNFAF